MVYFFIVTMSKILSVNVVTCLFYKEVEKVFKTPPITYGNVNSGSGDLYRIFSA